MAYEVNIHVLYMQGEMIAYIYLMLRYSPCGGTSKTATAAVTTRGVPLLMETNNNIFSN